MDTNERELSSPSNKHKISSHNMESQSSAVSNKRKEANSFGIRNYLHHFYEDCAGMGLCQKEEADHDFMEKQRKYRRNQLYYSITCATGSLLAIVGLAVLLTGIVTLNHATMTKDDVAVDDVEVDASSKKALEMMVVGAALFGIGGVFACLTIVLYGLEHLERRKEALERAYFEDRLLKGSSMNRSSLNVPRPISRAGPEPNLPTFELAAVQPLLDEKLPQSSADESLDAPQHATFASDH